MTRPRKTPAPKPAETEQPGAPASGLVEIECIIHNVHLGDGRELNHGDTAPVTPELADFLIGRKQVKRV